MAYIRSITTQVFHYASGLHGFLLAIDFYESETEQLIIIQYSESVARFLRRFNPIALNMMAADFLLPNRIFPKGWIKKA
ncbi:hypothetical protein RhiirA5_441700 [Rhizophagus irregularis]|uniref:Uncharacterized protein n=1 Tax=Rhizophagus irregularis TaxID=588596 RepID=A0A2N0NFG0_9GLOM|nr:hypothetical protein RhiirA5_441700 [Rhizophagus irregularis]